MYKCILVHLEKQTSMHNNTMNKCNNALCFELHNPLCNTKANSQESKRCCQTLWGFLGPNSGRKQYAISTFMCFTDGSLMCVLKVRVCNGILPFLEHLQYCFISHTIFKFKYLTLYIVFLIKQMQPW